MMKFKTEVEEHVAGLHVYAFDHGFRLMVLVQAKACGSASLRAELQDVIQASVP